MYTTARIGRGTTVHIIKAEGTAALVLCKEKRGERFYAPGLQPLPLETATCKTCLKLYKGER